MSGSCFLYKNFVDFFIVVAVSFSLFFWGDSMGKYWTLAEDSFRSPKAMRGACHYRPLMKISAGYCRRNISVFCLFRVPYSKVATRVLHSYLTCDSADHLS